MATIAQRNPVLLALQWASLDVLIGRTHMAGGLHGISGKPTPDGGQGTRQ